MDQLRDVEMSGAAPERTRREWLIQCPSEDQNANLIAPKDTDSWKSLLRAAEIRQHAPILDIAKDFLKLPKEYGSTQKSSRTSSFG